MTYRFFPTAAQAAGQREMTEVVHAELRLEAVAGELAGWVHNAGVVDQQIDSTLRQHPFRGLADRVERPEIELGLRGRTQLKDAVARIGGSLRRAAAELGRRDPRSRDSRRRM